MPSGAARRSELQQFTNTFLLRHRYSLAGAEALASNTGFSDHELGLLQAVAERRVYDIPIDDILKKAGIVLGRAPPSVAPAAAAVAAIRPVV